MTKTKIGENQNGGITIILIISLLLALVVTYLITQLNSQTTNTTNKIISQNQIASNSAKDNNLNLASTYNSKQLGLAIFIPNKFQVEEKFTSIILKSNVGEIVISKSGTNHDTIEDYLSELTDKNNITILDKERMQINGLECTRGFISDKVIVYFIFANNFIYTISTNSVELYNDLDEVAKSFTYIP